MKKLSYTIILLLFLLSHSLISYSQNSAGLNSSNYLPSQTSNTNPASIIDNRFKFQFNLLTTDLYLSNNYVGFKSPLKAGSFDGFKDYRNNNISENDIDEVFALQKSNVGLGMIINLGNKSSIGLQYQVRSHINIKGLNPDFTKGLYYQFYYPGKWNNVFQNENLNINAAFWNEISINLAFVLKDKKKHYWSMGIKPRFISATSSFYLHSDNLRVSPVDENTFNITNSNINFGYSENFDNTFKDGFNDLKKFNNISPAIDIGFEYEFRPKRDTFDYIALVDEDKALTPSELTQDDFRNKVDKSREKYKVKIGFSITDLGNLKFNDRSHNYSISASASNIPVSSFVFEDLGMLQDTISKYFYSNNNRDKITMSLPSTFKSYIDINLYKGFYLNLYGQTPINYWASDFRLSDPSFFAITPRWESNKFGVFIPLSYDQYGGINGGLSARLWFLTIGSNAMLSSILQQDLRSADIFVSLDVPILHKKKDIDSKIKIGLANWNTMKANEENDRLQEEIEQLTFGLHQADSTMNIMRDEIIQDSIAADSMVYTINSLESDIEMVLAENDSVYAQNAELKNDILDQQNKLTVLGTEMDSLTNDISFKQVRLKQLKQNLDHTRMESQRKDVQIVFLNEEVDSLQNEVLVLEGELNQSIVARKSATKELKKSENKITELTEQVQKAGCNNIISGLNSSENYRDFSKNSSIVPPNLRTYLLNITAKTMQNTPEIKCVISGFAASDEKPAMSLSIERIKAVKTILLDAGIKAERLESNPIGNKGKDTKGIKLSFICL